MYYVDLLIFKNYMRMWGLGDGGLGMGDRGLGIGPNPQSPIPNPQYIFKNLIIHIINLFHENLTL